MKNISIDKIPRADNALTVAFISEAMAALTAFEQVHTYLTTDIDRGYSEDMAASGISKEDIIMYTIDEYLGQLQLDTLHVVSKHSYFGNSGGVVTRLAKAIANMEGLQADSTTRVSLATPMTMEELKHVIPQIAFMIGDMTFALCAILHIEEILEAVVNKEEISLDGALKAYFVTTNTDAATITSKLATLKNRFPSVVPVFDDNPTEWKKLCDTLEPQICSELIDYGDQIYWVDILAHRNGELKFDENYISMLEERQNNPPDVPDNFPDSWYSFQKKVPQSYAYRIVNLIPYLTNGFIAPIVEGEPFTPEYYEFLERACNAQLTDDDFDESAKGSAASPTNKFS